MGCSAGVCRKNRSEDKDWDKAFEELNTPVQKVDFRNDFNEYQDDPEAPVNHAPSLAMPKKAEKLGGNEASANIVHIFLRCEELPEHKDKSPNTFAVVYTKLSHEEAWAELGRTETVHDSTWPNYGNGVKVHYAFEMNRLLRFEVFRLKRSDDCFDLTRQAFIGGAEARVVETMYARGVGHGWLMKDMINLHGLPAGRVGAWAEENHSAKNVASFDLAARKLKYTDMWKITTDPYFVIHRTRFQDDEEKRLKRKKSRGMVLKDGQGRDSFKDLHNMDPDEELEQAVMRSEVVRRRKNPHWKRVDDISSQDMCHGDANQPIIIEIWDWFRTCKPRLIGFAETDFDKIYSAFWKGTECEMEIVKKMRAKRMGEMLFPIRKQTGTLVMTDVAVERRYSFLDFVRGGTYITPIIAVDMTRGNLDPRHDDSLHCLGNGETHSDYGSAIEAICEVMQSYMGVDTVRTAQAAERAADTGRTPPVQSVDAFPVYGFGAKIPPCKSRCSHCFSLTGDAFVPFARGVDGVIDAYYDALRITSLHGPTQLQDVIELARGYAQPYTRADLMGDELKPEGKLDQRYFVLFIFTKGGVEDQQKTLKLISEAVGLPLSIVIIGMGSEDHSYLQKLNDEVKASQQLNFKVSCKSGHSCHQVNQNPAKPSHANCSECHCKLATCRTFWDCDTCHQKLCENCGRREAQKHVDLPIYRDMVTYVHYNSFRARPYAMAAQALVRLPDEIVDYYRRLGVKPRGLKEFETDQGLPKAREKIDHSHMIKKKSGGGSQIGSQSGSAPASRAVSKLSSASHSSLRSAASGGSTNTAPEFEEFEWDPSHLVPGFLLDRQADLSEAAKVLGYSRGAVHRALMSGIAEASLESLVDNLAYGQHPTDAGGLQPYKELLEKIRKERVPPPEPSETESEVGLEMLSNHGSTGSRTRMLRGTKETTDTRLSRSSYGTKESNGSYRSGDSRRKSNRGTKESNFSRETPLSQALSQEMNSSQQGRAWLLENQSGSDRGHGTKESLLSSERPPKVLRSCMKGTKESILSQEGSADFGVRSSLRSCLKGTKESMFSQEGQGKGIKLLSPESSFGTASPRFDLPGQVD